MKGPQNERAHARSHLPFLEPLPHLPPDRREKVLQKAWDLLSDGVKAILRTSPLAIHTSVFVHVLVLLAAGLALCFGESINLT